MPVCTFFFVFRKIFNFHDCWNLREFTKIWIAGSQNSQIFLKKIVAGQCWIFAASIISEDWLSYPDIKTNSFGPAKCINHLLYATQSTLLIFLCNGEKNTAKKFALFMTSVLTNRISVWYFSKISFIIIGKNNKFEKVLKIF